MGVCVYEAKEELTQKNQLKKRKQILNENCNRCGCAKSHWETVGNGEKQRGEMGKTVGNLQAHMYRACGFWIADWVAVWA